MKRTHGLIVVLFCSALYCTSCSAQENPRHGEDFIPAGKWESSSGDIYCVPKGNRTPDPVRLAAEFAAGDTAADHSLVGECKMLKYDAQKHAFSAKLACSQTSEQNWHKTSGIFFVYGSLIQPNKYKIGYRLLESGDISDVAVYHKISNVCTLNPKGIIVGPKTRIGQPLDPNLNFLAGWPEGTETSLPY